MIVRPTLPGRSVAPITAIERGRKIASTPCRGRGAAGAGVELLAAMSADMAVT
jgi:hypothetical protein